LPGKPVHSIGRQVDAAAKSFTEVAAISTTGQAGDVILGDVSDLPCSAAWTYAGTCLAELGEGRLSCDLTWVSDHWGDACRVIWHGPVITGLLWLGLSSDHWGRRLSCDLTWTNDRRWIRNKDLLDVGVDRLFDINTYVCTSRFPFSGEQTNPDEPRQGCDPAKSNGWRVFLQLPLRLHNRPRSHIALVARMQAVSPTSWG